MMVRQLFLLVLLAAVGELACGWVMKFQTGSRVLARAGSNSFSNIKIKRPGSNSFETSRASTVSGSFRDELVSEFKKKVVEAVFEELTGGDTSIQSYQTYQEKMEKIRRDTRISNTEWKRAIDSMSVATPVKAWTNKLSLCDGQKVDVGTHIDFSELDDLITTNEIVYFTSGCETPSTSTCSLLLGMDISHQQSIWTLRSETRINPGSSQCIVDRIEDFPQRQYVRINSDCTVNVFGWDDHPDNTFRASRCGNNHVHLNQASGRGCNSVPVSSLCSFGSSLESQIAKQMSTTLSAYGLGSDICVFEVMTTGYSCSSDSVVQSLVSQVRSEDVSGGPDPTPRPTGDDSSTAANVAHGSSVFVLLLLALFHSF